MSQNQKRFCIAGAIVGVFWALVVFSNSMRIGTDSKAQSLGLLALLLRWLPFLKTFDRVVLHAVLRKLAHLTEYAILGVLLARAFVCKNCKCAFFAAPLLTGALLAAIDECIQLYTPGRSGKITDVLIDTIGVTIGILLFRLWRKRYKKEENA